MAATLLQYDATSFDGDAVPVTSGDLAAYFDQLRGRTVLCFPDGADEYAAVTKAVAMPQAYAGGTLTAYIGYFTGAAGSSQKVDWEVYVEAVTENDAVDLDTAASFDSANGAADTVNATQGYLDIAAVTLTNKDSVATGDMVRFLVRRDSDDGTNDTHTATAYLLWLEIRES
jgi:hypothetical protein